MKKAAAWAAIALIAAGGVAGCGGDAGDSEVGATGDAVKAKVTFPAYIVYLQPSPSTNPLFSDVQAFITKWMDANLATSFPPHVSVTGFFDSGLPQSTLISRFNQAVDEVGVPFGQPKITGVHCHDTSLIDLHVKVPSDYAKFDAKVTKLLGAEGHNKAVAHYHITLFEADNPKTFPKSIFKDICADAKKTFEPRIALYDSTTDGYPNWRVALYDAPTKPTPTNKLSIVLVSRRVNP